MWVVRLNDKQLEVLRALIRSQGEIGPSLQGALEALEFARWDELPEAQLPWDEIAEVAQRQGISEADVIWDRCGRRKEPARPKPAPATKRKAAAKTTPRARRKPAA